MMSITKKLMSFSLALLMALGVLVSPIFANKSNAATRTEYTGVGVIDDFLNDPRWSEGNEWTNSTTSKLASGSGTGCYAYVADYAAYCFNTSPTSGEAFYDINEITVGDVISVGNPTTWSASHWFIVIKREGNVLTIAEGNAMDQVLMSRDFTILADENRFDGDRAERRFLTGYHFLESSYGWKLTGDGWVFYDASDERLTGWQSVDGGYYYFNSAGIMQTGWLYYNDYWYYLESSGNMHTGWIYDDAWYYLYSDGKMATGFIEDNGYKYYLTSSGAMVTGWRYIDGLWYYFTGSGNAVTGWLYDYDYGEWYFLYSGGDMATGWIEVNNVWYYLNSSGAMETGWVYLDGYWYYFNDSGAMETGWIYTGGYWYYLYSDGKMAADTYVDIYYVDASGAWVA